jgi:Holliday junction resolvase
MGGKTVTGPCGKSPPPLAMWEPQGQAFPMFHLSAALKAKGEQAEASFRAWLNQSGVAFLYIEQSPLNVPDKLRGKIKRPDYLVGIPHAGMMAFDVKAKSAYDDLLIFDPAEVDKLARFAGYFHLTVYFACLDLESAERFFWVPLQELVARPVERRAKARVVTIPTAEAFEVTFEEPFLAATMRLSQRLLEV